MKILCPIVLLVLISGCSSLRPVKDQTRYFVLSPAQQALPGKTDSIGIAHIELPEYLRKREIAWRSGGEEIHYASTLQWAEPLDKMIGRVLAANMGALLAPNYRRGEVQAEVTLSFSHFESDEGGQVTIEANWTIRNSSGNTTRGHAKLSSEGPVLLKEPAAMTAALSSGLANLSAEILKTIPDKP